MGPTALSGLSPALTFCVPAVDERWMISFGPGVQIDANLMLHSLAALPEPFLRIISWHA
ncbi:hypothetical protein [Streptomyces sp. NPDC055013]